MLHDCGDRCYECHLRTVFKKHKKRMSFRTDSYILFVQALEGVFRMKNGKPRLEPGDRAIVTCREMLDYAVAMGRDTMGSLASVVFDVLELRHASDFDRICDEMISVGLLPPHKDNEPERFSDYNMDLLQILREPVVNVVP